MPEQIKEKSIINGFRYFGYEPFDTNNQTYVKPNGTNQNVYMPFEYTNWWDEHLSWHDNCYLHSGLNPGKAERISGPDAKKVLMTFCTCSLENFPVGKGRHTCIVREDGILLANGVIQHTSENGYITHGLQGYADSVLQKAKSDGTPYDAATEDYSDRLFFHQLAGPRSLEVVEAATHEDLHDIKFMQFRETSIKGKQVLVLRMGMAGTLAYEVHGNIEDSIEVYNALWEVGQHYNIRKLGRHAYRNAHTEGGFAQKTVHFPSPTYTPLKLTGSLGPDINLRYRNPVEIGFGNAIKFDHEFIGRAALEKEKAAPKRLIVTLIWNHEDVLDVLRSQFEDEVPYQQIELVDDLSMVYGSLEDHADKVLVNSELVGVTSGRMFSPKYRKMISIASINTQFTEPGTEVTVVWGDPGRRQKEIRCTVAEYPIISENRNEKRGVEDIPHPKN